MKKNDFGGIIINLSSCVKVKLLVLHFGEQIVTILWSFRRGGPDTMHKEEPDVLSVTSGDASGHCAVDRLRGH